jgi:hypothetical protein
MRADNATSRSYQSAGGWWLVAGGLERRWNEALQAAPQNFGRSSKSLVRTNESRTRAEARSGDGGASAPFGALVKLANDKTG